MTYIHFSPFSYIHFPTFSFRSPFLRDTARLKTFQDSPSLSQEIQSSVSRGGSFWFVSSKFYSYIDYDFIRFKLEEKMIFYFSGTGNSLHVAKVIASAQKQKLASVAVEYGNLEKVEYTFIKGEMLGFIFPVYAWAPPKMVIEFIKKMNIKGETPYTFSISTCGGTEGNTTHLVKKALAEKGLKLDSAFTLKMPSNYIIGMDATSPEKEREILQAAEKRIAEINESLAQRLSAEYQLIKGDKPVIKTALVAPLFNTFALSTKQFYVTDACTRCKLCEKVCPVHTITVNEKPSWGKNCTQCLACLNRCPAHAIQYGEKYDQ